MHPFFLNIFKMKEHMKWRRFPCPIFSQYKSETSLNRKMSPVKLKVSPL